MSAQLRIHALEPRSRANGPGARFVVWVQGCTLACPGCFNPTTHDGATGELVAVDELAARIAAEAEAGRIEGLTVSGGEPLQQPTALLALLGRVKRETSLSVLVFTGYEQAEIEAHPTGPELLALIDVLVDGRYVAGERHARGLRGSRNQTIRLLTERYTLEEVEATPEAEIQIKPDGTITMSGVAPLKVK